MYLPACFEENHIEDLHRVITEFPLWALVLHGPNGLDVNHLPFESRFHTGEQWALTGAYCPCKSYYSGDKR
ncbi:MAG: FMN-binding negative transcriptional regulator [Bacteroidetes Order II. Incertae sedis bacterium]|nr:FMN-binding negative transcriptional regulator [Bacteroidetes Order II. bacterium]